MQILDLVKQHQPIMDLIDFSDNEKYVLYGKSGVGKKYSLLKYMRNFLCLKSREISCKCSSCITFEGNLNLSSLSIAEFNNTFEPIDSIRYSVVHTENLDFSLPVNYVGIKFENLSKETLGSLFSKQIDFGEAGNVIISLSNGSAEVLNKLCMGPFTESRKFLIKLLTEKVSISQIEKDFRSVAKYYSFDFILLILESLILDAISYRNKTKLIHKDIDKSIATLSDKINILNTITVINNLIEDQDTFKLLFNLRRLQ